MRLAERRRVGCENNRADHEQREQAEEHCNQRMRVGVAREATQHHSGTNGATTHRPKSAMRNT